MIQAVETPIDALIAACFRANDCVAEDRLRREERSGNALQPATKVACFMGEE
jgi:hypothetical protein